MKNTSQNRLKAKRANGLRPEYHFDYTKAKPNRFAGRARPGSVAVLLDPDVARVFQSAESVNAVQVARPGAAQQKWDVVGNHVSRVLCTPTGQDRGLLDVSPKANVTYYLVGYVDGYVDGTPSREHPGPTSWSSRPRIRPASRGRLARGPQKSLRMSAETAA